MTNGSMTDGSLAERLRKIRVLIEAQAEMALAQIDAALEEIQDAGIDGEGLRCPDCGESDPDKLEDTTPMGPDEQTRITCHECSRSFRLARTGEGVLNG